MFELSFLGDINTSIQIGDKIYSAGETTSVGSSNAEGYNSIKTGSSGTGTILKTDNDDGDSSFTLLGTVGDISINSTGFKIIINKESGVDLSNHLDDFLFFAKDNRVNKSSIKGYYSNIKFENNSKVKAELFAATCNISQSSK